jgi:tetratricopeptide (TPR) repeat protein
MSKTVLIDILHPGTDTAAPNAVPGTPTYLSQLIGCLMSEVEEAIVAAAGGIAPTSRIEARANLVAASEEDLRAALHTIITAMAADDTTAHYADRCRWALVVLDGRPGIDADPEPWASTAFAGLVDTLLGRNKDWRAAAPMAEALMDGLQTTVNTYREELAGRFTIPARLLHQLAMAAMRTGIDALALAPFTSESTPDWWIEHEGPYTGSEIDMLLALEAVRSGTRDVTYPEAEDAVRWISTVRAIAMSEGAAAHAERLAPLIEDAAERVAQACVGLDANDEALYLVGLADAALHIGDREMAGRFLARARTYPTSFAFNTVAVAALLVALGRKEELEHLIDGNEEWWVPVSMWCKAVIATEGDADMVEALKQAVANFEGDVDRVMRVRTDAALALCRVARKEEAAELLAPMVGRVEGTGNAEVSGRRLAMLADACAEAGDLEAAARIAERITDADERDQAWSAIATVQAGQGDAEQARASLDHIASIANGCQCVLSMADAQGAGTSMLLSLAWSMARNVPDERQRMLLFQRIVHRWRRTGLPCIEQLETLAATDVQARNMGIWYRTMIHAGDPVSAITRWRGTDPGVDPAEHRTELAQALFDAGCIHRIPAVYAK